MMFGQPNHAGYWASDFLPLAQAHKWTVDLFLRTAQVHKLAADSCLRKKMVGKKKLDLEETKGQN